MSKNFNRKKYILSSLAIIASLGLGSSFLIINKLSNNQVVQETAVLSEDQVSSLNLEDPTINSLYNLYKENNNTLDNENLYNILTNVDSIPSYLLELAVRNDETYEFVSNYPNRVEDEFISTRDDYTPGEIPLFLQWDERWGYNEYADEVIAINGCAPTSLAMVIVGLTGDTSINPQVIADYSYRNNFYEDGVGTKWSLMIDGARDFGINSNYLYMNEASLVSSLERGNVVVASVKPGLFTTTGHILVVTGLDEDGKLIINDPNSRENSSKSWDIDVFLNEVKALWEMSV